MDKGILISPAVPEMLPDILLLEEACFSVPWTRKMLEAELTGNQFAHFLVARDGARKGEDSAASTSQIVGYLCFWIVFEEVRLMNLAVFESRRRCGIATALVTEALRTGVTHAATRAVLEVRVSNSAAQTLYRRMGFVQVSTRTNYYANPIEDAVLMEMEPLVARTGPVRDRMNVVGGGSVPPH